MVAMAGMDPMLFLRTTDGDERAVMQAVAHGAAETRQQEREELAVLVVKNLSKSFRKG